MRVNHVKSPTGNSPTRDAPVEHLHRTLSISVRREHNGAESARTAVLPEGDVGTEDSARLPKEVF